MEPLREPPLTSQSIRTRKKSAGHQPLVALTAYDYTFARIVDEHADIVLVGDSLGMVVQGKPNTLSVTLEHILYHTKAVARGLRHAFLVADMPFMSFQISAEETLRNAGRLLAEGNAQSVKLEGGVRIAPTVRRLVESGIPVMGHIGLTPQSVHELGGFKVQGRTNAAKDALLEDALAIEKAGAFSIVLEAIPSELAQKITSNLRIPTIGIGAGNHCDGQILVLQDLLGMQTDFQPKFVKQYAQLAALTHEAVGLYAREVREGTFPSAEHSF